MHRTWLHTCLQMIRGGSNPVVDSVNMFARDARVWTPAHALDWELLWQGLSECGQTRWGHACHRAA